MRRRVAPTGADVSAPIRLNRRSLAMSVLFCVNLLLMPFKAYLSEDSPFHQSSAVPPAALQPTLTSPNFTTFAPPFLSLLQDRFAHMDASARARADFFYDDTYRVDVYRRVLVLNHSPTALVLAFPTSMFYTSSAAALIQTHANGALEDVEFASYVTFLDLVGFTLAAWVRRGNTISGSSSKVNEYTIYFAMRTIDLPYFLVCSKFAIRCLLSLGTARYFYKHYYGAVRRLLLAYRRTPRPAGVSHLELLVGEPTDFVLTNGWITLGYTMDCVQSLQFIGRAMSRASNMDIQPVAGLIAIVYLSRLVWFSYLALIWLSRVLHWRQLAHLYVPVDSLVVAALTTLNAAGVLALCTNSFDFLSMFYTLMQSVVFAEHAQYQVDSTLGLIFFASFTSLTPLGLGFLLAYWNRWRPTVCLPVISLRARVLLWLCGIRGTSLAAKRCVAPYLATFLTTHPSARANCTLSHEDEDCYLVAYSKAHTVLWVRRLVWTKTLALQRATSLITAASRDATSPVAHLSADVEHDACITLGTDDAYEWIY
ncbi:hypothetical protein SPRG_05033 [Saprolegnia parasitica CBS 223.65]|uniref:Uncharacterized protein n=1 Tax=Saprolegnia parasitica (strain CBS 223.65) TaxID=695850 RepID=A0A067CU56_SAPPC|nr:hypothetical protein SPRG_05033 [Saprolegnia parasitica CBS 223.65]KDO30322.1 hypothetical protein SPRG_05033 [Saprolegnia parasitica CBS 223.65]|eukprot:XP_012198932.1 hypothetical protein SPRG_05033 [Saprolegnia parasitica CBS 223.65]